MARIPLFRAAGVLALAFSLAASAADTPAPPAKDAAANKRLVYVVRHGSAKDLAAVLGQHFKGVADVEALPDPSSNFLLISAVPAAFDDVLKTLAQLDQAPQTVTVEILVLNVAVPKAEGDKPAATPDVDEKALSGSLADVEATADALQRKGALTSLKRIRLTAVEGKPTTILMGENKPFTAGMNHMATGITSRMITYRNTGTQADVTVHVSPDKVVAVDLKLEGSYPYTPEDGIPIGADENKKPVMATEFVTSTLNGKIDMPSGQARVAEGVKSDAKAKNVHTIVVVGATVVEPDVKTDK